MDNSITWTEKLYNGHWLMDHGYRDYIAARLLLNNHLIVQGLPIASNSVEKYLQALIVFNLKKRERYNYHFDKFEELKNILYKVNKDVTGELDYTIDFLENFIVKTENEGASFSAYNQAIKNNDSYLYENNFILNNVNKKNFMEKPDVGFSIYIQIGSVFQEEKIVKGGSTKNKYEGRISKFTEFGSNLY